MAGPTPKRPDMRQRRNRTTTASSLVDTNPLSEGVPELPKRRNEKGQFVGWRPEVREWWDDLWQSPMASEYVQADIHALLMLADLMDRYWREPTAALATEIRLQRQAFGLTPIDRRRLQWEVKRVEDSPTRNRRQETPTAEAPQREPAGDPRAVHLRAVK